MLYVKDFKFYKKNYIEGSIPHLLWGLSCLNLVYITKFQELSLYGQN
jgi:hypothetical protein